MISLLEIAERTRSGPKMSEKAWNRGRVPGHAGAGVALSPGAPGSRARGMSVLYYPISTQVSTLIAPIDPTSGLRRSDGVLLSVLPDIKVEYSLLTAAIVYED
jgi:hypothetical protein